jgi:ribosomal protein S18 acetylase RimI-like enzyme
MTHDRMQKPAPRREVVSWSSACDWAPIAALLGRDVAALRAEVAALPDGIEGVALLRDGVPAAVGLWVVKGLAETGRCALTWLAGPALAALAMVDAMEARARGAQARTLRVVERDAPGMGAELEARGYQPADAVVGMRRTRPRPPLALPAGLAEVGLEQVGLEAWAALENDAFAGVGFTVPVTADDGARIVASPGFDPTLLRFVVDADGAVGLLRGVVAPERAGENEVETIAVASRARGRGLGRWLLRRCEALLDGAGAREVVLRVAASNAPALALYRAEAWVERWRRGAWERAL